MNPNTIPESPAFRELRLELEARGEARGRAIGEAQALLRVLTVRGIAVDDAARRRIESCLDLAQLERWLERAVSAATIEAVFAADG